LPVAQATRAIVPRRAAQALGLHRIIYCQTSRKAGENSCPALSECGQAHRCWLKLIVSGLGLLAPWVQDSVIGGPGSEASAVHLSAKPRTAFAVRRTTSSAGRSCHRRRTTLAPHKTDWPPASDHRCYRAPYRRRWRCAATNTPIAPAIAKAMMYGIFSPKSARRNGSRIETCVLKAAMMTTAQVRKSRIASRVVVDREAVEALGLDRCRG
jgi:hypothetical protein